MRFLHLADLHLGKVVCGYSLLEDQSYALDRALEVARERNASAIVLAGDLYDKTAPSAEAVSLLDRFLTKASAAGLVVLAVPGNHDSAERVAYVADLLASQGVHFPPVYAGSVPCVTLEDEQGPVNFWLLPFLKPAHVRPFFPEADIAQNYTEAIRAALSNCVIDANQRNVLIAHQFVTSGAHAPQTSESELSLGGLDNVDASIFDSFDYVALGHVHRPQRIGRDTVRYAGSLLKYSLSEIPYPKSFCLVDMPQKGSVSFELIPVNPLREMREVKGPLEKVLDAEVLAQVNPQDYVHVILTDEDPAINAFSRVRAAYPRVMAIDYDNTRTRHVSALTADSEALEKLDPLELFERFFEEQNGTRLSDGQLTLVKDALEAAGNKEGGVS